MGKTARDYLKRELSWEFFSIRYEDFRKLAGLYDQAVISADFPSDLETPVSAFLKLRGDYPCFLLESAEQGERWGRYSILGFGSTAPVKLEKARLNYDDDLQMSSTCANPIRAVFKLAQGTRVFGCRRDLPFTGGAVGYFGFEILKHLDKYRLGERRKSASIPEAMFIIPDRFIVFDHFLGKMSLCAVAKLTTSEKDLAREYEKACGKIQNMLNGLDSHIRREGIEDLKKQTEVGEESLQSNLSKGDFEDMVSKAKRMILDGEIFQVVLSVNFKTSFRKDPFSIYRALRRGNPSPYMFYLEFPDLTLVGSSPEPMVTKRGDRALIRPIAGTRPRGAGAEEDLLLEQELKSDPKERAEHVMLVDLARNDLSRVCRSGTVKVTKLMTVERYSHVMHLVSQVEGTLKQNVGCFELLKASFPAGTVSGAPKIRACQIISELEPEARGPYAGAVGYLSYSGDMDLCIAIRMVALHQKTAIVQAGAGIVADSVPEREWEEVRNKAKAVLRAVYSARGKEAGSNEA